MDLPNSSLYPIKLLPSTILLLDLDTTGLIEAKYPGICRINFALVDGCEVVDTASFNVNPGVPIQQEATKIHGITNEMAQCYPALQHIWADIAPWLDQQVVAVWNAAFDWPILLHHLVNNDIEIPEIEGVFCLQRAVSVWAAMENIHCSGSGPSLFNVAHHLGILDGFDVSQDPLDKASRVQLAANLLCELRQQLSGSHRYDQRLRHQHSTGTVRC